MNAGFVDLHERSLADGRARKVAESLRGDGVSGVALTFVDNTGATRVKSVPVSRLPHAAAWGVGMSPVFDVFLVDDSMTTSSEIGGPGGDLRLHPDLSRLTPLHAQPGWAWAPADRYTQDGEVHVACQRSFARRMVGQAAAAGVEARMGFEVEWMVGRQAGDGDFVPACAGPAYGMARLVEGSDYCRDLYEALAAQGVSVEQLHPEYAAGQFEISTAPAGPVEAADVNVLVRETVRAVSARHGLRVSFAPAVVAGTVGNGAHVHMSLWRDGSNLFAGGNRRYGLTPPGESALAGLLSELPALVAVSAPSVGSYLRLVPSRWAGAYRCWGRENREAALRLVTGPVGSESVAANVEVKCVDASANPYLVVGALLAVVLAGLGRRLRLPDETPGDPAASSEDELAARGVERLPQQLDDALTHLAGSQVVREALGGALYEAFVAVRRAEIALFAGRSPEQVAAATRWRY
ncbi:MAG: glutamine synthetase family protein [Carbonactinosporaceae bacterium]